jgi:hypothetical protein
MYNYGFSVDRDGVKEEWLNTRALYSRNEFKRIFYRNVNDRKLDLSGIPQKSQENVRVALEKKALIVSLGSKLKIDVLKKVFIWFLNNSAADFGRPETNLYLSYQLPNGFTTDKRVQDRVIKYLSAFDKSIIGFDIEKISGTDSDEKTKFRISSVHKTINSDETSEIPFENESAGTLKMFALFPLLEDVLKTGGVLFVDELNARLHPLMVRTIVQAFLNPEINKNHAQLIFTTHDAWQLDNNLLRRDEIWFTEKDENGISSLYSLADFRDDGSRIRKDENYLKNYLTGKYGAIPMMDHFRILRED